MIKLNFAGQATLTMSTLLQDPTNSSTYHYTYAADGSNYELSAVLESNQLKGKMTNTNDGGTITISTRDWFKSNFVSLI